MRPRKIIDYCLYFNEIELLELRYHVLKDHVDTFVISEASHTFQGQAKGFDLRRNLETLGLPVDRFRILEVDVSDTKLTCLATDIEYAEKAGDTAHWSIWARQRQQRDALCGVLAEFPQDAMYIVADIDEIPDPKCLEFVCDMLDQHQDYILKLPLVALEGRADRQLVDQDNNPVWWDRSLFMCRAPQLWEATPDDMRGERQERWKIGHAVVDNQRSNNMGWHFTWMGGADRRITKLRSCAHGVNPRSIDNISDDTRREMSDRLGQNLELQAYLSVIPYDTKNLPQEIWQLPRVKQFLLPDLNDQETVIAQVTGCFVHQVLQAGGTVKPLLIDSAQTRGTALFNPTIMVNGDDIMINIRHCQYTLLHLEKNIYEHEWGPLSYLHPENDLSLTTTNFWARLTADLDIVDCHAVDTSRLDVKPLWEFVGLEDVRLVRWNDTVYYCGVRRDTTPHGQGRMELSTIDITDLPPREVARQRIPAPLDNLSYCEKNWMPVLDQPYTFVKWCNPTEVVTYDPNTGSTTQIYLGSAVPMPYDFRGGSQVIDIDGHYVALTHVAFLYRTESGRKDAVYRHVFVVWDRQWNVIKYGQPFAFFDNKIEFCCGMARYRDQVLITFGIQDNAAFVLRAPLDMIRRFIYA